MAEVINSFSVGDMDVQYVKMKATGIQIMLADTPGPLVDLYATLATEAHDDDGCPHTLEHLIFMGSEQYPFKGVLDSVANRCLAQGTNAWTDTDHTAYTLTTAGKDGFLNLLPVYLDHILYPTITDTAFDTEVHHITGDGEDAGVVYCEMQGRENSAYSVLERRLLHAIFPGETGFKSETGGIMANLRDLKVDTVRQYHRDFYRPDNLLLIVTGQVTLDDVIEAVRPMEERILAKGNFKPMTKPWQSPVPPFTDNVSETVLFASDTETHGHVVVAWRGPEYGEFLTSAALDVFWKYMTESAISPLRATFVDCPDPSCSQVYTSTIENSVEVRQVRFMSCPVEKIDGIEEEFMDIMKDIANNGVDMERMSTVIHRMKLTHLWTLEENGSSMISDAGISYFLYGHNPKQLEDSMKEPAYLDILAGKDQAFWQQLVRTWVLERPSVVLRGVPSIDTATALADEEMARTDAQREALGEAKLQELGEYLEQAIEINDHEVPSDILASFPIPATDSIQFFPLTTARVDDQGTVYTGKHAAALQKNMPPEALAKSKLPLQFDSIPSAFVNIHVLVSTAHLSAEHRQLLEIFKTLFFEVGVEHNGESLTHEDAIRLLDEDTISKGVSHGVGVDSAFTQVTRIRLKAEAEKFVDALQWMRDFIWHPVIDAERLLISVTKLLNALENQKQSGLRIATSALAGRDFDAALSTEVCSTIYIQAPVLEELASRLESEPDAVVAEFMAFRDTLLQPAEMFIHVYGDYRLLPDIPGNINTHLFPPQVTLPTPISVPHFQRTTDTAATDEDSPLGTGLVIGMGSIESSFLLQSAEGLDTFGHPTWPALRVVTEYLVTMEGPFWKGIRGAGLSYGYNIVSKVDEGRIYFRLTKSVDPSKAYDEAKRIIDDYISGESPFDPVVAEAARSSVVFAVVQREQTIGWAASESISNYLKKNSARFNRDVLERVQAVTVKDMQKALKDIIAPLFDPALSRTVITCNPSKVDDVCAAFTEKNRVMESTDIATQFPPRE